MSNILYRLTKNFILNETVRTVKLEIEYSTGPNGELEFETVYPSDESLTPEEETEIRSQLENGQEEDIANLLANYYRSKKVTFNKNHYE